MVKGQPDYLVLPSGNVSTATVKNPALLIEVLSQSTLAFDLGDKLELYKQLPSLQQVLFVSQHKPWVISYVRSETPGLWLNTSAHNLTESIAILENEVELSAIYKKFTFA